MTDKKKYDLIYSALFALLFLACFGIYLILHHKSFLRIPDGLNQYYMSFLYFGRWGRSILRGLIRGGRLAIPLWDPSIGYGADIPTTFAFCFWDPFCWISVFIPSRFAEYGYEIMIVLKLYTAGAAFSRYAFHRLRESGASMTAVLAGSLVYVFSAVSYAAFGQSTLINPLILFPLLMIGADHIYEKRKSRLYVIILAFSFAQRFSTACIMLLLILLYYTLRLIAEVIGLRDRKKKKDIEQNRIISRLDPVKRGSDSRAQHYAMYVARRTAARNSADQPVPSSVSSEFRIIMPEKGKGRFIAGLYLRFLLETLLALGLSAVSLIPYLRNSFSEGLSTINLQGGLLTSTAARDFFRNCFLGFTVSAGLPDHSSCFGFGIFTLICVFVLFTCRKKYLLIKLEFLLMTFFLCVPFIGHSAGDFQYTTARWIWAYALVTALITAIAIPEIPRMNRRQCAGLASQSAVYIGIGFLLFSQDYLMMLWVSVLLIVMTAICVNHSIRVEREQKKKSAPQSQLTEYSPTDRIKTAAAVAKAARNAAMNRQPVYHSSGHRMAAVLSIVMVCLSSVIMSASAISRENILADQAAAGEAYSLVTRKSGLSVLNRLDFSDGSRYDSDGTSPFRNAQWLYGASGIDFSGTVYNQNIDDFHDSIGLAGSPSAFSYAGLNQRCELLALFGVNHYLTGSDKPKLPAGFSDIPEKTGSGSTDITSESQEKVSAESQDTASGSQEMVSAGSTDAEDGYASYAPAKKNSLFYVFQNGITEKDYLSLTPLERQQALMQAIVTDPSVSQNTISADQLTIDSGVMNYSIESGDGVELTKVVQKSTGQVSYMVSVNRADAYIDLILDNPVSPEDDSREVYLYLKNLKFVNGGMESFRITAQEMYHQEPVADGSAVLNGYTIYNSKYTGKKDFLVNIGKLTGAFSKIRLYFNTAGTYTIDDMDLLQRSDESIGQNINALGGSVTNIKAGVNAYSCYVSMGEDSYLFSSIPYSTGWTVYDNGKEVSTQKADLAFTAVRLESGSHHITMRYLTPGLLPGLYVTIFSILILIVVFRRKKK